jgi:hypothetical protein
MENDAQRTAARIDVARANSWTVRFAEMRAAIDGVLR